MRARASNVNSEATRLALAVVLASGCGGAQQEVVPRRLDGEVVPGHFVSPTSYEAFVRGELALSSGDCAAAVSAFRLASLDAEDDALALSRLAHAEACSGDRAAAHRTLGAGLERFPSSEALWLEASALAEAEGDRERALEGARRAQAAAPTSLAPVRREATLLANGGDPQAAVARLRAFAETRGRGTAEALAATLDLALVAEDATLTVAAAQELGAVRALLSAERERVFALLARTPAGGLDDELVERLPARTTDERRFRVELALALGKRALAREWLTITTPEDLGGFESAAELALRAGDDSRAHTYAELGLAVRPSPRLLEIAGDAAFALGDFLAAAAHYTRAIKLGAAGEVRGKLRRTVEVLGLASQSAAP